MTIILDNDEELDYNLELVMRRLASSLDISNHNIVFTGALTRLTRTGARGLVEAKGGKTGSSVSKKTTLLVVGEKPGAVKVREAVLRDITIIKETDFIDLIKPHLVPDDNQFFTYKIIPRKYR